MNILEQYSKVAPDPQNAVDLFKDSWTTNFPEPYTHVKAGRLSLFEDARIAWAAEQLGGFEGKSVLELGPLEGVHTYLLEKQGAESILAIEANSQAYLKCLVVKEMFNLQRSRFLLGDFMPYLRNTQERFDAIVASGVLYHMRHPVELIASMARVTDQIFLWTHYFDPDVVAQSPELAARFPSEKKTVTYRGFEHTVYRQEYLTTLDWKGYCGGVTSHSLWLNRHDILACLEHFGFDDIRIGFEDPQNFAGASFAVTATRTDPARRPTWAPGEVSPTADELDELTAPEGGAQSEARVYPAFLETVACNQCGEKTNYRRLYTKQNLDISRCGNCGLVYAGPLRAKKEMAWLRYNPDYFWQDYLPAIGAPNGQYDMDIFDQRYSQYIRHLSVFQEKSTLLEVGCGAGFFLKSAQRAGWGTVTGLEVSEAAAEFGRDHLGLDVRHSTLEDADIPADTYDVVAMFDSIEHLLDPTLTLEHAFAALRPGGAIMVTTPNFRCISRHALQGFWASLNPIEHLYYFTEKSLGEMLQKVGFTRVQAIHDCNGISPYSTMNPSHTEYPDSLRARAYKALVSTVGIPTHCLVRHLGLGDQIYMLAQKPE